MPSCLLIVFFLLNATSILKSLLFLYSFLFFAIFSSWCFCPSFSGRVGRGAELASITRSPHCESSSLQKGVNSWKLAVIVSVIGGILLSACAFCLYRLRQLRLEEQRYNEACLIALNNGPRENEKDLPQISLRIIQLATDNFSEENKLGEGGFGSVFKGRFRNGQLEVAVKRLSASSGQGLKEFRNEVRLIAKLQHKNLVRLIGCCLEKGEKLLIYEYMPNTSLDAFLKDPMKRSTLDWEKRYNIILGTARGVLYLHQDSRLCVIHRDLKAGNVLLDENMNPKISDFGMARIFSASQGQANTKVIVGTYGYMAPEYAMSGLFSVKSDVYSFGILLLEIISGQLNARFHIPGQASSLVEHAWSLWCEDKGSEFVDPVIRGNGSMPEMLRCMHIGLLCIQEDATSRPTMSLVVLMLGSNGLFLPTPTRPAFFKIDADSSEPCSSSNGFTVSQTLPKRCNLKGRLTPPSFHAFHATCFLLFLFCFQQQKKFIITHITARGGAGAMGRTACSFIFLITFLLPVGLVDMAESPLWFCTHRETYKANGTFYYNLRRALVSLAANASLTGFYNVTVGKSPDQVNAAVQCRGDLDGEACQVCVSDAATQITQRCPNSRGVIFAFQTCVMYYRDASFTIPKSFMYFTLPSTGTLPDPQRFRPILISFFNNLIVSATTNPSGRLFWGDKFYYTKNVTVYCLAQCVQYLPPQDCKSCLDMAFILMLKDIAGRQGGGIYYRLKCSVRYETYPFFIPSSHNIAPSSLSFISSNCSPPVSSDIVGSPFHRKLKALLSSLTEKAPVSGFYSDSVGLGSSQVYGQVLCRGDVPVDVCWNCTAQASTKILEVCANSRSAIIWLDHCQLRYSDVNFAGVLDVHDRACQPAAENASDPANFNQNLRILTSNLTLLATQSSPNRFFATGASVLTESKKIYALVQCVRDITVDQCGWCLQNASSGIEGCSNGKQGGRILRGSCSLAFGVQPFFLGDPTLVLLPPPSHGHKPRLLFAVISIIVGVLFLAACALFLCRRRYRNLEKLSFQEASSTDAGIMSHENEADYDLLQVSLRTIQHATDNFSDENKLGEGGYGPVYKGKLPNGQEVAVKRLSGNSGQGLKEFRNEVELIGKLQHINLVRLIGCCLEKGEKLLIYEYMPNRSLDAFLKDQEGRALLDWEKRSNIIMGIAKGILYLHRDSRLNIIHRDLKAGNILLDEQLNPKISDFGMARIFSGLHSQATTSVVVGTYGYMAPEYAMGGAYSSKSDVYSFGILLLEIISGQLNASFYATHQARNLVGHAWSLWCEENGTGFIDPAIKGATSTSEMLRCMHVGLLCIQEDAATRPTMSTVVLMLGNSSIVLPLPTQPALMQWSVVESNEPLSSVIEAVAFENTR
ncbi:uncharacterized protein LOC116263644 [Nymphaea colorata]|nr:uncharacterized protein LOC116263644 [Nymphaea colorata]